MAESEDSVRLPELPVFKRYSLALRQEFAGGEEVLAMLDRTALKVQQILDSRRAKKEETPTEDVREDEAVALPEPSRSTEVSRRRKSRTKPKAKRARNKRQPSIIFVPQGRARSRTSRAGGRKSATKAKTSTAKRSTKSPKRPATSKPRAGTSRRKVRR